jgi:hypothetical protein
VGVAVHEQLALDCFGKGYEESSLCLAELRGDEARLLSEGFHAREFGRVFGEEVVQFRDEHAHLGYELDESLGD